MEEVDEVAAGAAKAIVTTTATEEKKITEGEWEYPPAMRGLGQDRGRYPPGALQQQKEEVQGYRRLGSVDDKIEVWFEVRVAIEIV